MKGFKLAAKIALSNTFTNIFAIYCPMDLGNFSYNFLGDI